MSELLDDGKWKFTICFDFDGVCARFDSGYEGPTVFGEPIREVAEFTQKLHSAGYHVILWTTRKTTLALKRYLRDNGFWFDSINSQSHNPPDTSNKPIWGLYIGDRATRFDPNNVGNSIKIIEDLLAKEIS